MSELTELEAQLVENLKDFAEDVNDLSPEDIRAWLKGFGEELLDYAVAIETFNELKNEESKN